MGLLDFSGKTVVVAGGMPEAAEAVAGLFRSHGAESVQAVPLVPLPDLEEVDILVLFHAPAGDAESLIDWTRRFEGHLSKTKGVLIIVAAPPLGLTRILGAAWAPRGIRVNGIAPGVMENEGGATHARLCRPRDIARAALFLASEMAAHIQGQTIVVDGGAGL